MGPLRSRRSNSEPEPSTPDLLLKENDNNHQNQPLTSPTSLDNSNLQSKDALRVSTSAPVTSSMCLHPKDEETGSHGESERIDIGKMSWHFTAQMLDAIHAHLANPLLRPITLRCADKPSNNPPYGT